MEKQHGNKLIIKQQSRDAIKSPSLNYTETDLLCLDKASVT